MRVLLVAAIVLVAALAGCSGKKGGDDEIHYTCPNGTEMHSDDFEDVIANFTADQTKDFLKTKCPKSGSSGSGSKTNSTTLGPNVLPVLKLNITDSGGNVTNVTLKNGNLTFDATGSFDPDGQLSAIAISVKDSNQTRTKPLYDLASKKFSPATFKFDRAGPVNVSIAMVDDRAGFTTVLTKVFVNEKETKGNGNIYGDIHDASPAADACKGAPAPVPGVGHEIYDSAYFKTIGVTSVPGVMFIEVIPGANNLVTICDPDGAAISAKFQDAAVVSDPAGPLPTPAATKSYYVGVYAGNGPVTTSVTIITHYEPKPAAAAA